MDCKTVLALIDAYLDGELDRAQARALESHLDSCPTCAAALASSEDLRRALRDGGLRHHAPAALRERVRATLDEARATVPVRSVRRLRPAWWQLAAASVTAFAAGVWLPQADRGQAATQADIQLAHDLFESHWRALAAASPVDVVSSDHHTVKPWFAGKIAESPPVQDFAAQGFSLLGGRIDYVGAQRVAVLVYRHGQHVIDVYALPQGTGGRLDAHASSQGYWADAVRTGDAQWVVVTDMDATERAKLAGLLTGVH